MVQACSRLRLALKALHERGVVAQRLEHHLDANLAVKHLVARKIHAAHAAVPKLLFKLEVPEHRRRGYQLFRVFVVHWTCLPRLVSFYYITIPANRPL